MIESKIYTTAEIPATLYDGHGGSESCSNLLTEDELIKFLHIPQISKAKNYHNVIVFRPKKAVWAELENSQNALSRICRT